MDDSSVLDAMLEQAADPRLIPGIYNYCDRCCWRCRFTERCLSHRHSSAVQASTGDDPGSATAAVTDSLSRTLQMLRALAARLGVEATPRPEDQEAVQAHQRRVDAAFNEPLVVRAREYAQTASPIVRVLLPIVQARGDAMATAAVVRIQETCTTIASKTYRAISDCADEDFDPSDLQSDANGSAKIARLLIDESRGNWRVLMEVGRAAANGVPARLVALLDEIDAALADRFPRALEFKRPGFDTNEPASADDVSAERPGAGAGDPTRRRSR